MFKSAPMHGQDRQGPSCRGCQKESGEVEQSWRSEDHPPQRKNAAKAEPGAKTNRFETARVQEG
jgi:hypothetical protein